MIDTIAPVITATFSDTICSIERMATGITTHKTIKRVGTAAGGTPLKLK